MADVYDALRSTLDRLGRYQIVGGDMPPEGYDEEGDLITAVAMRFMRLFLSDPAGDDDIECQLRVDEDSTPVILFVRRDAVMFVVRGLEWDRWMELGPSGMVDAPDSTVH